MSTESAQSYGIEPASGGVLVHVYVVPRSSANRVVGAYNGELKVTLTTPPVKGEANKALVELLAGKLGLPRGAVSMVSGHISRHKVVRVEGIDSHTALGRLRG
jgi:uncharacterized protein (TIGR00251 family)